MIRPLFQRFLAIVALAVCLNSAVTTAQAACADVTVTSGASVSVPGQFNPFGVSGLTHTATIDVSNPTAGSCTLALLIRPSASAGSPSLSIPTMMMTSGANNLSYSYTSGSTVLTVSGSSVTTFIYDLNIPLGGANALAIASAYTDTTASILLYEWTGSFGALLRQVAYTPSADVAAVCDLPTPSVTTMNFPNITEGLPNTGTVLTSDFSSIRCNSPAELTLVGDALRRAAPGSVPTGFDDFINFRAIANFDGAAADLTTNSTVGDDSNTSAGKSSGATGSGAMIVSVNLVPGNTVLAGQYTSVLTVRLTPSP